MNLLYDFFRLLFFDAFPFIGRGTRFRVLKLLLSGGGKTFVGVGG